MVEGRVQGVNFRRHVKGVADHMNILGQVRNLADGSVEFIAEGEEETLRDFITDLMASGPPIRVDDIQVRWSEPKGEFSGFDIIR